MAFYEYSFIMLFIDAADFYPLGVVVVVVVSAVVAGAVRDVDDCCCSWGICHFIFKAAVVLDVGVDDDVALDFGVVLVVFVIVVDVISSYTVRLFSLVLKITLEKEKKIETSNSCKRISFSYF